MGVSGATDATGATGATGGRETDGLVGVGITTFGEVDDNSVRLNAEDAATRRLVECVKGFFPPSLQKPWKSVVEHRKTWRLPSTLVKLSSDGFPP